MRIGGEFEIDLSTLDKPCVNEFVPMPGLNKLWVDTGRSALSISLEEISRRGGVKKALLPAYICPSVIAPFAIHGFQIRYYSATKLADTPPPEKGETVLFAHYFGKKNLPMIEWIRNQPAREQFFVIEDCVQASLNANVGEVGDFVITSYRKFLSQPDGAILGSCKKIHCTSLIDADEAYISAKLVGKLLRKSSSDTAHFLNLLSNAENRLELLKPRKMSWLSTYMLRRTDIQKVASLRRDNWLSLYQDLSQNGLFKYLTPLFDNLSDGDVPLGLPVRINHGGRDEFRQFLATQHIYCPIHWELDHLNNAEEYSAELMLSRNILTLPIDQRLTKSHIEYFGKTIANYFMSIQSN